MPRRSNAYGGGRKRDGGRPRGWGHRFHRTEGTLAATVWAGRAHDASHGEDGVRGDAASKISPVEGMHLLGISCVVCGDRNRRDKSGSGYDVLA